MAKLQVGRGLDDYLSKLGNLSMKSPDICEKAAEAGGDIVADAIRSELNAVPVDDTYTHGERKEAGPKSIEKAALQASMGIAPVRNDNGFINVKIGFDGYNKLGKPNAMIARSVVKGTSFMKPHNFVGRGTSKSRGKAELKMKQTVDDKIYAIMEGDSSYAKL